MKISVIFTTYNSPRWLEKVLWGFEQQTDDNFEVVIADDGSKTETRDLIDRFKTSGKLNIQHIWHEDKGFQKCRILNKAIIASKGEYIVITDGDCVPRKDFVATHRTHAEPGRFLSAGYFKLPMSISEAITYDDIVQQNCFRQPWLIRQGMKNSLKFLKLTASPFWGRVLNRLTLTNKTWNGHNASCFKNEAIKVNGFDERMRYGGLDCEFGGRLINAGVKPKQIRYSAICVHLDHPRGYVNEEDWKNNRKIRRTSVDEKLIETPMGIKQH